MKILCGGFSVVFLLIANTPYPAQQLIQKDTDIEKIKINENVFIGKPLSALLREIKPSIMRVIATPSKNIQSDVGNFRFNFMDNKVEDSTWSKGKTLITLVVFVKEPFDWDFKMRPKGKETVWTAEDAKRYKNLTIVGFRIYGDAGASN